MREAVEEIVAGVLTNKFTGEEVAPPKKTDTSYVVLTGALVDHATVAYSTVSEARYPVTAIEFRQPKIVEPLTRLSGDGEVEVSVEVHFVALDGDVRLARLAPASVNETPVGGLGAYVAPPSLYVFEKDPRVNAAKATPLTKLRMVNTATILNGWRQVSFM